MLVIPRSREVGQSYVTSVWTTLVALWTAFAIVYRERPQLVLTLTVPGMRALTIYMTLKDLQ